MIPIFDKRLFEEDHGVLGGGCAGKPRGHRRVVCAANRLTDGTILLGARHWDGMMQKQVEALIDRTFLAYEMIGNGKSRKDIEVLLIDGHEQGFIDQWGNYMDRREAWRVAEAANQILFTGPGFSGPELYSENLY